MNAPKLRFKEFKDELSNHKFKDICTFFSGGTPTSSNKEYYNGDIPFIRSGEIYSDNTELFINQDAINNSSAKVVNNGDLLLALYGATSGNVAISKIDGAINQAILCINPQYGYSKVYIKYLLENKKETILKTFLQGGQGNLSAEIIKSLNYSFPQIEEQEKIGDFLSLLDKKIELQTKKIEDLKLFKLCINNILFNGNKTIKLKDICECKSSTISLSDIEYDNGIYPIYGANGEIKKINSYQNDKDYLAIIKDGAGVGKTIICNKKSSIIATLSALIPNGIPVYYFNELINKIDFSKYIVGSGIPHIYFKDYSNEKLYLHEEKKRVLINNLFKRIIIKIELEENKLHLLETVKKGLMQNMFV